MMIASNGLGAMFGNFLAGYAIDWGGADALLGGGPGFGGGGGGGGHGSERKLRTGIRERACKDLGWKH